MQRKNGLYDVEVKTKLKLVRKIVQSLVWKQGEVFDVYEDGILLLMETLSSR